MEQRFCKICGSEIVRKPKQKPSEWRRLRTCKRECTDKLRSLTMKARGPVARRKVCPYCWKTFKKPSSMMISRWEKQEHCSIKCEKANRKARSAKKIVIPNCKWCERPVPRRTKGKESYKKWSERQFCQIECRQDLQTFLSGHVPRACEECGNNIEPTKARANDWKNQRYCCDKCENIARIRRGASAANRQDVDQILERFL